MRLREIVPLNEARYTVYHGTGSKFDAFQDGFMRPHFFTTNREYAMGYVGGKTSGFGHKPKGSYMITAEVTIERICDTKNDPQALEFYNTSFLDRMNVLNAKYKKPLLEPLAPGKYISFVDADDFYRYCKSYGSPYDGMLVDEGLPRYPEPAIVPFDASQIRIVRWQRMKPQAPALPAWDD